MVGCSIHSDRWWICGGVCRSTCRSTGSIRLWVIWDRQPAVPRCWLTAERHCRPPTVWQQWAAVSATAVSTWRHSATPAGWSSALPNTSSTVIRTVITRVYLALALALALSISIAQTPTVRPRAHYIVIISCVIRSSMHGWKETFSVVSERQLSIVFFSVLLREETVWHWHHTGGVVNMTNDHCYQQVSTVALCYQQLTTPVMWWRSRSLDSSCGVMPSRTAGHIHIWTYFVIETRLFPPYSWRGSIWMWQQKQWCLLPNSVP